MPINLAHICIRSINMQMLKYNFLGNYVCGAVSTNICVYTILDIMTYMSMTNNGVLKHNECVLQSYYFNVTHIPYQFS